MNASNNVSNPSQLSHTIKTCVYLLDFLVCTAFTILILHTVLRELSLKKEVRFFLLSHHLVCMTLFFGFGTIFNGIRALKLYAPVLVCWIIFAIQIVIGRGLMLTLVLMALNTCCAVCWPLKYLAYVHLVKIKFIICLWIIALLEPFLTLLCEGITAPFESIMRLDPTCPGGLSSLASRISGIVFIIVILTIISVSYILLFREGKRSGHFNSSNYHARRTIVIHGAQTALHILPTIVTIGIGGMRNYIVLDLTNFIIFSFAQCLSPVVYGLRCSELRNKISQRLHCCATQT